jgi:acyl-CoA thioesterase I
MTYKKNNSLIKITFFGDSIFVGQGVSIYRGWVSRISEIIDKYGDEIGQQFLITNASVNGRTTRQALEDMPYSVQSHGVDILVLQFGLNDCNYWATDNGLPRVSIGAFIENLKEIIERGKRFGAKKIFLNNSHPTTLLDRTFPETTTNFEDSNRLYSQAIAQLASSLGPDVHFQDIYTHFKNLISDSSYEMENFLLSDGLHLSVAGHEVYYSLMKPLLISAIQDVVKNNNKL